MSEEDERTLWCGNLSEKVTDELLYELFLQAGPVEMVKIPRDSQNPKRQRSYAFITYAYASSVDYAINIYEGTKLFQRTLTLHRKSKNGPNQGASPRVNNGGGPQQQQHQHNRGMQQSPNQQQQNPQKHSPMSGGFNSGLQLDQNQFGMSQQAIFNQMLASLQGMQNMNMQALGQLQQGNLQNKMNRSQQQQHQQKPYSRDRGGDDSLFSRDRGRGGPNRGGGGGGGNQRRNDYRGRR